MTIVADDSTQLGFADAFDSVEVDVLFFAEDGNSVEDVMLPAEDRMVLVHLFWIGESGMA